MNIVIELLINIVSWILLIAVVFRILKRVFLPRRLTPEEKKKEDDVVMINYLLNNSGRRNKRR